MKITAEPEVFLLLNQLLERAGKTAMRFEMVGMD
jgi:hypothetical protein